MVTTVVAEDSVIVRFGGGLNTRASEDEVDPREATAGQNFLLDAKNRELRPRPPFDLLGTATNGAQIRGFASLLTSTGDVSMLVQAGGTVYEWDGSSFTSVGAVNSSSNLRGRLDANFILNDEVIITDLSLLQPVLVWDGTTLSTMTENLAGTFLAKYAYVSDERAFFANVISNSVSTPHMLVASERGDNTNLSVSDRPADAAAATDPFFVLAPDFKPINGLVEGFGRLVFSTQQGRIFQLLGSDASDYAIDQLFALSGADGYESLVNVGNDVFYGKQGKIEALSSTQKFGDVEADDLTISIGDQVEGYSNWTAAHNNRLNRTYFFPNGQQEAWVYNHALEDISKWSRWNTQHASAMTPTAIMSCLDPLDGLEYIFWGDSSGRLYRMEGTVGGGDAGSASINTSWTSGLFSLQLGGQVHRIRGWIKYRKVSASDVTVTITVMYSGDTVMNQQVTLTMIGTTGAFYGGSYYYGGETYYGATFAGRITKQEFFPAGKSSDWQVKVEVDSTADFRINEIGMRFETES